MTHQPSNQHDPDFDATESHSIEPVAAGDYLWDRTGSPDPHVARLERLMADFAYRPGRSIDDSAQAPPSVHVRSFLFRSRLAVAAATALVLTGLAITWFTIHNRDGRSALGPGNTTVAASWIVRPITGSPMVASTPLTAEGRLAVGQLLETDAQSAAELVVADIGRVTVDPGSRVRLIKTDSAGPTQAAQHRIELQRGRLQAFITAPPRLFFVDTPSAIAVDYGCQYILDVAPDGSALLEVSMGQVMLEGKDRGSLVPVSHRCRTRSGHGPGTPFHVESSAVLRAALDHFDFDADGEKNLPEILVAATPVDAVTLWSLLSRVVDSQKRETIYDRLIAVCPPPEGVTRDGVLAGNEPMLANWCAQLGLW